MTNEEYLKECRDARDDTMKELSEMVGSSVEIEKAKMEIRKVHALEIIAETLIKIDKEGIWIFDGDKKSRG